MDLTKANTYVNSLSICTLSFRTTGYGFSTGVGRIGTIVAPIVILLVRFTFLNERKQCHKYLLN